MASTGNDDSSTSLEEFTWKGMWYEFTATTTFHGVHYITEATPYILRRLAWILIVGGVSGCFVSVIWNRAEKFSSHHKNVNVDVLYNSSIRFPSVTICNQNYVKMTETYKQGTYNVISAYFSDNGRRIRDADEVCRHRYVGQFGARLKKIQPGVEIFIFADLILDSCRRLCSDLAQAHCLAFSFHKKKRKCYITNIDKKWNITGKNRFTFEMSPHPEIATFHKYDCFSDHLIDDNNTTRIGDGVVIPRNEKDLWEASNWTADYTHFLARTGHQREDMIHSCVWQGNDCTVDDFEMVMTDYGVCYSFNFFHPQRPTVPKTTAKTGSNLGLKLVINVEEYDYMPGPYSDAGIKMFLHEQRELPMVRDLGFAVPPGRHSLIDVRYSNLKNARPPVGTCGEKKLEYFSNYTWFRCWRDCEARLIVRECHCIAPFMASLTKDEVKPVCNMTHFFQCGLKAIESADAEQSICTCVEPCDRVIYDPAASNAALSSLSIETILATKREKLQARYREALNVKHRTKESRFLETAESLIDVTQRYTDFVRNVRGKTTTFESNFIKPVVASMKALFNIFQEDLNEVQFEGLEEALQTIALIYGPSRDTSYFLVDRVIRNSKLVSLHTQNLVLYGFFYTKLEALANETIEYVNVVQKTLPRYNDMVHDVNATMTAFKFSMDVFTFPPERLAKDNNICRSDGELFYTTLAQVKHLLKEIVKDIIEYRKSGEDSSVLEQTQLSLRELYIGISNLTAQYKHIKEDCLEQFKNAIADVIRLNETYKRERKVHLDLDYTFDFDEQAAEVVQDRLEFNNTKNLYLEFAALTKQELQEKLQEEELNDMISRARDLIVKIQFRLIERLRRRVDKARADVYDWYESLVKNADKVQEYMPYRFSEVRTRNLTIWKAPKAVIHLGINPDDDDSKEAFLFTHSVNTSGWRRRDFHRELALTTIENIIDTYFDPINTAIDAYDADLSDDEQQLTTAIKQVRNLMNKLRSEEKLTTSFVLRNFLQVDVYFSELRFQVIQQLEAYTVEDLMSDVGGYMGLLLGASMVTVFELLDVIIYGFILKIKESATGLSTNKKEKIAAKDAQAHNPTSDYFRDVRTRQTDGKDEGMSYQGANLNMAYADGLGSYGDMVKYKPYA